MQLLFVPYAPCLWEHFILSARGIMADQMDFLAARLPRRHNTSKLTFRLVGFIFCLLVQPNQKPSPARLGFVILGTRQV
jgi:hypothetical protein